MRGRFGGFYIEIWGIYEIKKRCKVVLNGRIREIQGDRRRCEEDSERSMGNTSRFERRYKIKSSP
jgi:hypothetical protein